MIEHVGLRRLGRGAVLLAALLLAMHACVTESKVAETTGRRSAGRGTRTGAAGAAPAARKGLLDYARVRDPGFSPDGRHLVYASDEGETWNVWVVEISTRVRTQLTFSPEAEHSPEWSPAGDRIAYLSDFEGNESHDIFWVSVDPESGPGGARRVTRDPADDIEHHFSPDGARLVFASRRAEGEGGRTAYGIWTIGFDGGPADRVVFTGGDDRQPRWSPAGDRIAFRSTHGAPPRESDIFVVAAAGGAPVKVSTHDGGSESHPRWSADGESIVFASDANGFTNLGRVDLGTREVEWLTDGRFDLAIPTPSPGAAETSLLAYTFLVDGNAGLGVMGGSPDSKVEPRIVGGADHYDAEELPIGVLDRPAWSPSGRSLAFTYSEALAPGELWVWSEPDGRLDKVVDSKVSSRAARRLAVPEIVVYPAPETEEEIVAHLYRPEGRDTPSRAVVWLHDEPRGQWMNRWTPEIQSMVAAGAVVIVPQFRGSGGFGPAFERLNDGRWGDLELADVRAAVRYLEASREVTTRFRVAVGGSGYGGFLALLAAAREPDIYHAAISISGWTDLAEVHVRADASLRRLIDEEVGMPEEAPEWYSYLSPHEQARKIRGPVLLIGGENDPLVSGESLRNLARAIRQGGGKVDVIVMKAAGRRPRSKRHRERSVRQIARFVEENL